MTGHKTFVPVSVDFIHEWISAAAGGDNLIYAQICRERCNDPLPEAAARTARQLSDDGFVHLVQRRVRIGDDIFTNYTMQRRRRSGQVLGWLDSKLESRI